MELKKWLFPSLEICYILMFIYAVRINIYINIYSFNQTIVFYGIYSCIHRDFTKCLVKEIWFKVLDNHWSTCV